jgi:hypothetical protein
MQCWYSSLRTMDVCIVRAVRPDDYQDTRVPAFPGFNLSKVRFLGEDLGKVEDGEPPLVAGNAWRRIGTRSSQGGTSSTPTILQRPAVSSW